MKRVLIVVSSFRPAMLADMHRARMLAWELPKLGWEVEVLTPRASEIRQDAVESDSEAFFAPNTPVHEVGSWARGLFDVMGSRTHAWRTLPSIRQRGSELIRSKRFDLVYFTTTTFLYFALGPSWTRRFGVPYVTDFHDPWFREDAGARRDGWRAKAMRALARHLERRVMVSAAGLVVVSPRYKEVLQGRYQDLRPAWLELGRNAVIPFGAQEADLAAVMRAMKEDTPRGGEIAVHYVGAGGSIMVRSFSLICRALAVLKAQGNELVDRLRIRLFGTTYGWKAGDVKTLEAVARDAGVGHLVSEEPQRVSYRRSLQLLLEGDGALVLGVDDPGYTPSKLFSYALSGKPLLASLRRESPAFEQLRTGNYGHAVWFDEQGEMPIANAVRVVEEFLKEASSRRLFDRRSDLAPFLGGAMARRHAELFDACLTSRSA